MYAIISNWLLTEIPTGFSVLFFIVARLQPILFFNKTLFPMGTALPGSSLYILLAFQPAKL